MKNDIAIQKAVDFIREQAVVTEASESLITSRQSNKRHGSQNI